MMDCKKALTVSNGDVDVAVEHLRKNGQSIVNNRQDKEAKEGTVLAGVSADGSFGVILELNSETDFVARSEDFAQLGAALLEAALATRPADLESMKAAKVGDGTADALVAEAAGRIKERIALSRYSSMSGEKVFSYVHSGGKVGVLCSFSGVGDADVSAFGKDVGMQIASMNPVSLDRGGVDAGVVDKETEIGRELARKEGKPEAMLDRIAQGRLNKFFRENVLLEQEFVKDPSVSVEQYLKRHGSELKITGFQRFQLGVS